MLHLANDIFITYLFTVCYSFEYFVTVSCYDCCIFTNYASWYGMVNGMINDSEDGVGSGIRLGFMMMTADPDGLRATGMCTARQSGNPSNR